MLFRRRAQKKRLLKLRRYVAHAKRRDAPDESMIDQQKVRSRAEKLI